MFTPLTYDSLGTSLAPPQPARPEIDQQALDDRGMLLPHVRTFQSLYNLFSKTYSYRWDEAVRHGLEDARAMRNDTYFRALLQERLSPLGLWDWTVEPDPDPLNPKAPHSADRAKVAAMLRAEAAACPGLMKFRRHLGWCTWFGRVANQVVTAPSRDLPWGPHTVRQWEPVDGDKLHYSWSDTGADGHWCVLVNPGAAAQYPGETTVSDRSTLLRLRRPDYRRRFVVATHEIEDAPYEDYLAAGRSKGVGLRDFVFWGWWLRDEMLSWMISLAEKAGSLGIMLFGYPVDSAAGKAQAVQNAKDVNSRNALAVPMGPQQRIDDWVKVVAMPTEGLRFLKEVTFDYFDKHFERLFVGQTLSSGTEGGGLGGTGVADMHEDTKFTLLKFDALNQAECLTEDYVRVLQGLNHPDDRWKYRWVYQLPDPKSKDKLEAITKAASLPGPKLTYRADDVRKLVGMAKPDAGDEVVGGDDPADPGAAGNEGDPSSGPGGQPDPKAGGGEGEEPAPGMDVLVAAMVQAAADGDRQAVDSLAEIGQDPDGLAVLLDDLEAGETPDVPEERDGQPPLTYQGGALYAYAWSRATTKSGGVKAVGTGEHQGKTLYGKRAEAALRGRKPAGADGPTKKQAAKAAAAARRTAKADARTAGARAAADALADPASVKPEELTGLAAHLQTQTKAQLAALAKQVAAKVSGAKADLVARLVAHVQAAAKPKPPPPPPPPPEPVKPALDWKHVDPNHPVVKAIDSAARRLTEQFVAEFAAKVAVVAKADEYAADYRAKESASVAAGIAYADALARRKAKPTTDRLRAEYEAAKAAAAEAAKLDSKAIQLGQTLGRDARRRLAEVVGVTDPPVLARGEKHLKSETPNQGVVFADAHDFVSKVTNWSGEQKYDVVESDDGRAYYSNWGTRPRIAMGSAYAGVADSSGGVEEYYQEKATETHVHELGHMIEYRKPGVQKRAQEFLAYRLAGEEAVSLAEKFPKAGFTTSEAGARDQFDRVFPGRDAYYVGKKYDHGATEVVSMGLQQLHRDPATFAVKDPEYFAFMVSILKGQS